MSFDDYKLYGSEAEVKKAGKFKTQGKLYVVQDGDILSVHTAAAPVATKQMFGRGTQRLQEKGRF